MISAAVILNLFIKTPFLVYRLEVKHAQMNDFKEDIEDLTYRIEKQKQRVSDYDYE